MPKKLIFTLIFILKLLLGYSQNGQKILIYAEKSDYLMPLIEKKLSEIKYFGKNNKIISKITNLNRINSNITNEKILNEAMKYHSGLNIGLTDSMKKTQNIIVDLLKVNELF